MEIQTVKDSILQKIEEVARNSDSLEELSYASAALGKLAEPISTYDIAQLDRLLNQQFKAGAVPSAANLPNTFGKLRTWKDNIGGVLKIVGMGSSVGVGAALTNAAVDCPVAKFTEYFNTHLNKLGNINVVHSNRSVSGSTLTDGKNIIDAVLEEESPDILVLAFGMNDAGYLNYFSGQTYPYVDVNLATIISKAQAAGCDAVVMTTPHQISTSLPSTFHHSIDAVYPATLVAPVNGDDLSPKLSELAVEADWTGDGTLFHQYYLAHRVNQSMVQCAMKLGAAVINVESYWFDAVRDHGESALYDSPETVHPNLLGHQLSYWRAISDYIKALANGYFLSPSQRKVGPRLGVNTSSDSALSAKPFNSTDDIADLKNFAGDSVVKVDKDGGLSVPQISATKQIVEGGYSRVVETESINARNVQTSGLTLNTVSGDFGEVICKAFHNGIGTQLRKFAYINVAGSLTVTSGVYYFETAVLDVVDVSVDGERIKFTPAAGGTDLDIVLLKGTTN